MEDLVINRSEKYWTSCVLPQIVCGNGFNRINKFFKIIGIPAHFILPSYSNKQMIFQTEFDLNKIKPKWKEIKGSNYKVPDIVIILTVNERRFLIVLEGKMFNGVTAAEFKNQLDNQKKVIDVIKEHFDISDDNIMHVGLLLQLPNGLVERDKKEKLLAWDKIRDEYTELSGDYFYNELCQATYNKNLITNSAGSYGKNKTDSWYLREIINNYQDGRRFYVGRSGGLATFKQDCIDGSAKGRKYEVNTDIIPNVDVPPNSNWFPVEKLMEVVNSRI